MVRTRFALILYFRMVAHKAACHTLSKAFLKSMKTWYMVCKFMVHVVQIQLFLSLVLKVLTLLSARDEKS